MYVFPACFSDEEISMMLSVRVLKIDKIIKSIKLCTVFEIVLIEELFSITFGIQEFFNLLV